MNHVLRGIVLLEIAQVALARKVTILTGPVRNAKGQNVVGQNAVGQNGPVGIDQKVAGQRDEAPKAGVRKGRTGLRVRLSLSKAKWPGFRKTFMAMLMA